MNTEKPSSVPSQRSILELPSNDAKKFFLQSDSYCNVDLPRYIVFKDLIESVSNELEGKNLEGKIDKSVTDYNDVNYIILHNKDGKYAWRPYELIHPVLYVSLVNNITQSENWDFIRERFRDFQKHNQILCKGLPVVSESDEKDKAEQVSRWWQEFELHSIELSLDFNYLFETDITDCYGSIYTHSIGWALHSKEEMKKRENRKDTRFIGNIIDNYIQRMRYGQTNGIPQGSVLMDFIAEMVLGEVDREISIRLNNENIQEYKILRYRDDYRIFVNSSQIGEKIIKIISEVNTEFGLKINHIKTKSSNDVIRSSIKEDKLSWIIQKQKDEKLQRHLLIIHDHSIRHPNSGSLIVALQDYYERLSKEEKISNIELKPLIAIVTDIAYRNPRTYSICSAILSQLLVSIEDPEEKLMITDRIYKKFLQIPNTGHMQIWLQRITFPLSRNLSKEKSMSSKFSEKICKLVEGEEITLWNSEWINEKRLKSVIDSKKIINYEILNTIEPIISSEEVELFLTKTTAGYY